ncbi:NHL repeat-containing protein [Carboxylicivirga linearis]|uniref:NHL repeat containing protein n=1 Tax=Carboxylicivirga linearis TaxID=1628157 RepID=A0ABS5JW77_9BACT|nr:hypothetical protein [Carboxylicivirga linearis]MBS2099156.1 hypothetical protein [Carboxylicivirga linearis]
MEKTVKIIVNIIIFIVVIGFIAYMVSSVNKDEQTVSTIAVSKPFTSPLNKVQTLEFPFEIGHFELYNERIILADKQSIHIFNKSGERQNSFTIKSGLQDIAIMNNEIFVLYPTAINVYSMQGDSINHWEACSDNSAYCAMALTNDFVFVTDAQNKNICKYTRGGNFKTFIFSPHDFIIPSYTFDIFNYNDTIYAVNSGRHLIERYTTDGDFISSFGGSGTESGFFAGCCNPAYIDITDEGRIYTSEKGNPRISIFNNNGQFDEVLLDNKLLGGGNKAYELKVLDDHLFVANKNRLDIYAFKNKSNENN